MHMSIYHELILDHYHYPHNKGSLIEPDGKAHVSNVTCGDKITMYVRVQKNLIEDIRFDGEACAISTASASLLTDHVKGKSIKEANMLTQQDVLSLLQVELTPVRLKCALVPLETLHLALSTLDSKK